MQIAINDLLTFKCLSCIKTYEKRFNEDFLNRFQNTHTFCLMLRKSIYLSNERCLSGCQYPQKGLLQQYDTGGNHKP